MKKIILTIAACLVFTFAAADASTSQYFRTKTYIENGSLIVDYVNKDTKDTLRTTTVPGVLLPYCVSVKDGVVIDYGHMSFIRVDSNFIHTKDSTNAK